MKFFFRARNASGEVKEGIVEALTVDAATQILQRNNLVPVQVEVQENKQDALKQFAHLWEGVNQKELVVFFRQLSTLVESRVPLVSSIAAIRDQTENSYLRILLKDMTDNIQDGMSFSDALAKHPETFTSLTVSMIRAGEVSGSLQKSIAFVADTIEKNYYLFSKIRGALFYPTFVIVVAGIIGFLVMAFVLPKLTEFIKGMHVAIPWYTNVLIVVGDVMSNYWWAMLIVIVGIVGTILYYFNTEDGKNEWDVLLLRIPIVGGVARGVYIARFSENLGALLGTGIPVVRALVIVSDVVGNNVYREIILRATDAVKGGGNMSEVLVKYPTEFPAILTQMIRIGEDTGSMAQILKSISAFYAQEVDNATRNLTTLIEPILIVVLGIGVAIMAVGILMPIYNIAGQM